MEITRYSASHPVDEIIAGIEDQGAVIIEDLVRPTVLEVIQCSAQNMLDRVPCGHGQFVGDQTKRTGGLLGKIPQTADLVEDEKILEVMDWFLGPNCSSYQLHISQMIAVMPGEGPQMLHRDGNMFPYCQVDGEKIMNVMWAISDFTADNGATEVVLESNHWTEERFEEEFHSQKAETLIAEMKAGSALIYTGTLVHGAGANGSLDPRIGIVMGYNLGWLRQYENQFLSVPLERVRELSPRVQQLMGYEPQFPALGLFEGRSPMEFIAEGFSSQFHAAKDDMSEDVEAVVREIAENRRQAKCARESAGFLSSAA